MVKIIIFVSCAALLAGCSTPNPNPAATPVVYQQVQRGMDNNQFYTHHQIYALLGPPYTVNPPGDIDHCRTATWKIPHGTHGWGHLKISFNGDLAVHYDTSLIIARVYKHVTLDDVLKMQPFDATVEEVRVAHHWFFDPDVTIDLMRNDNGKRLALEVIGVTEAGLQFANELHQGNSYIFPKVMTDFVDAHDIHKINGK